jgi:hypothetical protein
MMLQKRLSGEPVGYSALGIFVITKTTILSVRILRIASSQ